MKKFRIRDVEFEILIELVSGIKNYCEIKFYKEDSDEYDFDYLNEKEFFELVDSLNTLKQTYLEFKDNVQNQKNQ